MANGFWNSFNQGYAAGDKIWNAQARNAKRRDLDKLGPEADVVSGDILKVGDDQMVIERGAMGIGPDGAPVTPEQAYRQHYQTQLQGVNDPRTGAAYAEPSVSQGGIGYTARAGSYDQGVYEKTEDAQRGADRHNYGLMRKQADVYRRYGEDDMARTLSRDARMGEREDARFGMEQARERRTATQHDQSMKLGAIQLSEAELKQKDAQLMRTVYGQIQAFSETNGKPPSFAEAQDIARKAGATPDQIFTMGTTVLGINDNAAKAFKQQVAQTVQGKGYAELIALHKTDPMFDDKRHFVERRGPKGELILDMFDETTGKVVGSQAFANEAEATAYLSKAATEPENLLTWMMALEGTKLGLAETRSKIAKNEADAAKEMAHAGLYGRTNPNRVGSSGSSGDGGMNTALITRMQAQQTHLSRQLAAANERVAALKPGSPEHATALNAQNDIARQLYTLEGQLNSVFGIPEQKETKPSRAEVIAALNQDGWTRANVERLGQLTGEDITSWAEYRKGYSAQGLGKGTTPKASEKPGAPFITIGGNTLGQLKDARAREQRIKTIEYSLSSGAVTNAAQRAQLEAELKQLKTQK